MVLGSWDLPGARLLDLVAVMDRLRSPGGCPWDAEQTHESLVEYLVEEAYETVEAIETGDDDALREELGDLLLQVVFHARIAAGARRAVDDRRRRRRDRRQAGRAATRTCSPTRRRTAARSRRTGTRSRPPRRAASRSPTASRGRCPRSCSPPSCCARVRAGRWTCRAGCPRGAALGRGRAVRRPPTDGVRRPAARPRGPGPRGPDGVAYAATHRRCARPRAATGTWSGRPRGSRADAMRSRGRVDSEAGYGRAPTVRADLVGRLGAARSGDARADVRRARPDRVIDGLRARSPDDAATTPAGDHRFDDRLPDLSDDGVDETLATHRPRAVGASTRSTTSRSVTRAAVDLEILRAQLGREAACSRRSRGTVEPARRQPRHGPAPAARPRLRAGGGAPPVSAGPARRDPRLPRVARRVARPHAAVHVETAIGAVRGHPSPARRQLDDALDADARPAPRIDPARAAARRDRRAHRVAARPARVRRRHARPAARAGEVRRQAVGHARRAPHARRRPAPGRGRPRAHRGRDRPGGGRLPRRGRATAGRRRCRSYAVRSTPSPRTARSTTRPCLPLCLAALRSRRRRSCASTTSSPSTTTRSRSSRCPRSTAASRSRTATRPGPLETARAADVLRGVADADGLGRRRASRRSTASTTRSMLANLTVHEAMPGHVLQLRTTPAAVGRPGARDVLERAVRRGLGGLRRAAHGRARVRRRAAASGARSRSGCSS